ncbi:MAG TPA: FimV/HubP family polar landmark protein, partial [Burkholderiales bacterium]|nr:FimV/HubP family polar landmark protein [Burkholderiales bacterium]
MLLMPLGADAAGLGRLTVISALGQPLNAEVELLSVQKNETITGRLSTPEVYQQANVPYNNALVGTRVSLERRANGQSYLKITSPRAITEPFLELLIEINSEHGRVVRQYTTLLDPPGYGRAAGEIPPPVATGPASRPPVAAAPSAATSPLAPGSAAAPPAAAAKPQARAPAPAPAASGARQYGPIKPGETLGRIARSVKPEGVSLEQTLVGLYRQNPDAFIRKNMNLVRSGRILKVPEASELAATPRREAVQEVRTHVADWNAYRNRVADRVATAREEGRVTSGRIGTSVADKGTDDVRDTVRLSKGDTGAKGKGKAGDAERMRALEEEAVAREKALAEANARIVQLEQIIKDSKRAAELKGAPPPKAADKAAPPSAVAVAPAPEAAKKDAPKATAPEAAKAPEPAKPTEVATGPEAPKAGEPPKPTEVAKDAPPPAPVAKAKKAAPPPEPAPETSFVDDLFSEPLYLALAGGVVILGGVGLIMARRRRSGKAAGEGAVKVEPSRGGPPEPAPAIAPPASTPAAASAKAAAVAGTAPAPFDQPAPTPTPAPPRPAPAAAPQPARPAAATAADDNDLDFNVATPRTTPPPAARTATPPVAPVPPVAPQAPAQPARPVEAPRAAEPPRAPEPPPRAPEP